MSKESVIALADRLEPSLPNMWQVQTLHEIVVRVIELESAGRDRTGLSEFDRMVAAERRAAQLNDALRAIENDAKLLRSLLPNNSVAAKLADGIREGAALAGDGGGA